MKQNIVGFIFARGGSKGIPGKNIRVLGGKPLIAYAIETAYKSHFINQVIVSTDDKKIAKTAQEFGAEVPFLRPKELAEDNTPEWLAWQHAIGYLNELNETKKIDIFVSIPPTSPLRSVEDINNAIRALLESDADIVITTTETNRHPSFNMIRLDENNYADLVLPPERKITRRQDAPKIYDMTTVAYVAKSEFVLNNSGTFEGKVKTVLIPPERALDIDTELDFEFAEFLLNRR